MPGSGGDVLCQRQGFDGTDSHGKESVVGFASRLLVATIPVHKIRELATTGGRAMSEISFKVDAAGATFMYARQAEASNRNDVLCQGVGFEQLRSLCGKKDTCAVAFSPSVLIKCSICPYHQTLARTL